MSAIIPFVSQGGDIVETGSNANGYYVKYKNGIMECWGETDTFTINSGPSNSFYWHNLTITFPQVFSDTPYVFATPERITLGAQQSVYVQSVTATTFLAEICNAGNNTATSKIQWRAIGRWSSVSAINAPTYTIGRGIIESGSNTNGSYIKYEDGTLECWNGALSGTNPTITWTLPAAMMDTSFSAHIIANVSGAGHYHAINSKTTTAVVFGSSATSGTETFSVRAIGRWQSATNIVGDYTYGQGIVETATNSNGTYIKFDNGTMICYLRRSETLAITNTAVDNFYYAGVTWTLPATFIDTNYVVTVSTRALGRLVFAQVNDDSQTTTSTGYYVSCGSSVASASCKTHLMAIGRWK